MALEVEVNYSLKHLFMRNNKQALYKFGQLWSYFRCSYAKCPFAAALAMWT